MEMTFQSFVIAGKARQVFRTIKLAALYEAQHKSDEARDLMLIQLKDDKENKEKNDNGK
jgi:hypothetical protein